MAWLVLSNNVGILPHDAPVSPAMIAATPEAVEKDPSETNALSEYLMAHQQFSPSTAMQGVVSYVRTVSAGEASR
ncbi:MAG: hypothetical protein GTO41_25210 [Burkholderiales bacterium]|nr:hypothetical protein [Burkholderiales bacterium]